MTEQLRYRPWVAQVGMRGMLRECAKVWGDPNRPGHTWPMSTLEAVCKRGAPQPFVFDPNGANNRIYFLTSRRGHRDIRN